MKSIYFRIFLPPIFRETNYLYRGNYQEILRSNDIKKIFPPNRHRPISLSKNSKKRENYFCTSLVYTHTHASFHRKERMFETRPNWHVYRVINRAHPSPASPCASIQANAKNGRWFDPVGSPMTPAALSAQPSPGAGNCDLTFARRQCQPTTLALPEWDAALAADRCNRATPDRENWIRTGSHVFSRFRCTRNPRGSRGS